MPVETDYTLAPQNRVAATRLSDDHAIFAADLAQPALQRRPSVNARNADRFTASFKKGQFSAFAMTGQAPSAPAVAIACDLNGTLVDELGPHVDARLGKAVADRLIAADPDLHHAAIVAQVLTLFAANPQSDRMWKKINLLAETGYKLGDIKDFTTQAKIETEKAPDDVRPLHNARAFLQAATARHYKIGIPTNSQTKHALVECHAAGIDQYIDPAHVIGAEKGADGQDNGLKRKPDPATYHHLAALVDAPLAAIENTEKGVKAAKAAGALVFAVNTDDQTKDNRAHFVVQDLMETLPIIDAYSQFTKTHTAV